MSLSNLELNSKLPSIAEYYSGKTIALTGGTGFVGHCVIEKLLRCCPDIRKIFVLLRQKRNKSAKERVASLVNLPVFEKLKTSQPRFADKIIPVYCNLEEEGLGLSNSSIDLIQNEVNVFIHSAATLRFDEHLRLACTLNTVAVRSMLQLCRGIQNLEALVHVSTAYSYCNRKMIGEEIYQTGWDFDKLNDAMQWMTDEMIEKLTPDILRERPNTYTLTKAFGEEILAKEGEGLPICIVRPSVIGAAYNEPVPGWCSNLNGATGIVVAVGKGLLHSIPSPPDTNIDIIPVDFVVNGVIAAGWKTGLSQQGPRISLESPEEEDRSFSKIDTVARSLHCIPEADTAIVHHRRKTIPIYQIAVGQNNVTIKQWGEMVSKFSNSHPFDSVFQVPFVQMVANKRVYHVQSFILDYLPAYLVDTWLVMFRQKPMMLRYNKKVSHNIDILQHFITNQWVWEKGNVNSLYGAMSREDQKDFNMLSDDIDWLKYIQNYIIGSKMYIMKETAQDYAAARRKLLRLRMLGYAIQAISVMIFWRLFLSKTTFARNLWHLFLSLLSKFINFFHLSSALQKSKLFRF